MNWCLLVKCLDEMCLTVHVHLVNTDANLMKLMFIQIQIDFLHKYFTELFVNIEQDDITETSQHMKGFRLLFLTNESAYFDVICNIFHSSHKMTIPVVNILSIQCHKLRRLVGHFESCTMQCLKYI